MVRLMMLVNTMCIRAWRSWVKIKIFWGKLQKEVELVRRRMCRNKEGNEKGFVET
jgi:hypothetical protein